MANRVLRDSLLTNRKLEKLDWFQQTLFIRLILACDDFGRYYAAPDILRGRLFSVSSQVTQELVARAMARLEEVGFLVTYPVRGELYCWLPGWDEHQVCRTRRARFPEPPVQGEGEPEAFAPSFHEAEQTSIGTAPEAKASPNPIQTVSQSEAQSESESASIREEAAADEILAEYARICKDCLPCRRLTPARREKLRGLLAKGYTPDVFREAFRKTQESTFLVHKKKQPVPSGGAEPHPGPGRGLCRPPRRKTGRRSRLLPPGPNGAGEHRPHAPRASRPAALRPAPGRTAVFRGKTANFLRFPSEPRKFPRTRLEKPRISFGVRRRTANSFRSLWENREFLPALAGIPRISFASRRKTANFFQLVSENREFLPIRV